MRRVEELHDQESENISLCIYCSYEELLLLRLVCVKEISKVYYSTGAFCESIFPPMIRTSSHYYLYLLLQTVRQAVDYISSVSMLEWFQEHVGGRHPAPHGGSTVHVSVSKTTKQPKAQHAQNQGKEFGKRANHQSDNVEAGNTIN